MEDSELPSGWRIHSLHKWQSDGSLTTHLIPKDKEPTDYEVGHTDLIRVTYTSPNGQVAFRNIHGAPDKKTVADLIERVTKIVSPV